MRRPYAGDPCRAALSFNNCALAQGRTPGLECVIPRAQRRPHLRDDSVLR